MTAQARKRRGADDQAASGEERQSTEQPVSWLELFFDLIFVTAFDRLAQRLLDHPSLSTFGVFTLLFVALWWAWLGNTSFAARSGNIGRAYRWGTLAQMLALAALAVSVRGDLSDVGAFFALAYAAGRVILILMLVMHGRRDRGRQEGGAGLSSGDRTLVKGFGAGASLWVASAFLEGPAQLTLWGLALACDLHAALTAEARHDRDLPHQAHFPERVGLLLIVFLGAVVTELIRAAAEQRLTVQGQAPAALALVTIMAIWRLYFDEAHTLPALLAGRSGRVGTLLAWTYTHLPLMLGLSLLSVGIGLGVAEEGAAADRRERLLVGAALAVVFVCLTLLRAFSVTPLRAGVRREGGRRGAGQPASAPGEPLPTVVGRAGLSVRQPLLGLSGVARLGGAAALLLLMPAPIGTLGYQTICAGVTLAVAYLGWRDPVRGQLAQIEEDLHQDSEEAQAEDADRT
ncbi:low temperature requirement protein A [Deinococcus sp.]|uniref:low temperature requirement protein A n=1 Tax=Deinococcus sp. TaxID=47478 RepID=UPI003C7DD476